MTMQHGLAETSFQNLLLAMEKSVGYSTEDVHRMFLNSSHTESHGDLSSPMTMHSGLCETSPLSFLSSLEELISIGTKDVLIHPSEEGKLENTDIDLNKTPQQKPKRKKHRPKVIREGKPAKTPKPVTPKPVNPSGKRKYVRKTTAQVSSGNLTNELTESVVPSIRKRAMGENTHNPCSMVGVLAETRPICQPTVRRRLNFESEARITGDGHTGLSSMFIAGVQSHAQEVCPAGKINTAPSVHHSRVVEVVENLSPCIPFGIDFSIDQVQNSGSSKTSPLDSPTCINETMTTVQISDRTLPENPATPPQSSRKENMKKRARKKFLKTASSTNRSQRIDMIQLNSHEASIFLLNRERSDHTLDHNVQFSTYANAEDVSIGVGKLSESQGVSYNDLYISHGHKKHRAEHENTFTSNITSSLTCMPSIDWKRHMEMYDTTEAFSLQLLSVSQQPLLSNESRQSDNHIETQFVRTKSRIKGKRGRKKKISETSIHFTMNNQKDIKNSVATILTSPDFREKASITSSVKRLRGSALVQDVDVLNEIIQKLLHLSLNEQLEVDTTRVQNAIVPYAGGGMMVHYEGLFDLTKKRRPRPKVNLDSETNRVWNLLMGKEDANMTEETEIEKEKWWKKEREFFHGIVDSFIARMHLVQGDRGFSKWKGSVVDSVVGVFLTQNVSDHLSSSAFMALAARFPVNARHKNSELSEERISSIEQDNSGIVAHDEISEKQGQSEHELLGASSLDSETAISNESFGSNTNDTVIDHSKVKGLDLMQHVTSASQTTIYNVPADIVTLATSRGVAEVEHKWPVEEAGSSQNSTISSQNSYEHPIQTADLIANFREDDLTIGNMCYGLPCSITFTELLNSVLDDASCNNIDTDSIAFTPIESTPVTSLQDAYHVNPSLSTSPLPYYFNLPSSSGLEHHYALTDERIHDPHSISSEMWKVNTFKEIISSNEHSISNVSNVLSSTLAEIPRSLPAVDLYLQACEHFIQPRACPEVESSITKQFSCSGKANLNEVPSFGCDLMKCSLPSDDCAVTFQQEEVVCETQSSKQAVDFQIQKHKFDNLRDSPNSYNNSNPSEILERLQLDLNDHESTIIKQSSETSGRKSTGKKVKDVNEKKTYDWDSLRKELDNDRNKMERSQNTLDSVDWEAVRSASVKEISDTIRERGMNNLLAERIKEFLDRVVKDHGSIDLEWLREIEPGKAKDYLLSIRGLGLKSVECVRLLTLHHLAFPVDTNVGRICVRLGWVPLQPLPESLQLHLLELYPILETIQKYLWPRLCKLDQKTLYELHYQMITFGKVFCTKSKPNCNACPMRGECKHFASAFASARLALPGPEDKSLMRPAEFIASEKNCVPAVGPSNALLLEGTSNSQVRAALEPCEPIIEEPATPEAENITEESAIEDAFYEDPDEIPTIKLNIEEFTQNLQNYMQSNNFELQDVDMSKALVAINPEVASIPMPKLKNVSRLRTEHLVYELPDSHPLLEGLEPREEDDPSPYLLAIWSPGETAQSTEPPNASCSSQETGGFCNATTCFTCNSKREAQAQIVRGTILIPCRTAMRGSFPLNGTYFQVNEVFADHYTSRNPIDVPREWLWSLRRRTVYFGTSVTSIFKGLTTEEIQLCFWRGFVCVRGFDKETRAPRPLYARLHFPASKAPKSKQLENSSSGKRTANRI